MPIWGCWLGGGGEGRGKSTGWATGEKPNDTPNAGAKNGMYGEGMPKKPKQNAKR